MMYEVSDEHALTFRFIAHPTDGQVLYALLIYFTCSVQTVIGMTRPLLVRLWPLSTRSVL